MPINIQGKQTQPLGYKKGPGLDSKGRAGPTLQSIADRARVNRSNAQMMENIFDIVSPLSMYSGDAEGAYLPSKAMQNAQGLAKVFQDWYKGGTPTINVPFDSWPNIIKFGKFKNQMELAGKDATEAWKTRIEMEKKLGGYPYPRKPIKEDRTVGQKQYLEFLKHNRHMSPDLRLELINGVLRDLRKNENFIFKNEYSESLAKQNPVYGHLYNPKYNHPQDAIGFGDTYAEMSDLVKEKSKYALGDTGGIKNSESYLFSSDDMLGNTSRLERALFHKAKTEVESLEDIKTNMPFLEMWVPNHLARLNNINSVHFPRKSTLDEFPRAVSVQKIPEILKLPERNISNIENTIPPHSWDMLSWDD